MPEAAAKVLRKPIKFFFKEKDDEEASFRVVRIEP
jgi:hypothetical protein